LKTFFVEVFDEVCTTTDVASTENGDIYLSCGSDQVPVFFRLETFLQYTIGVEVTELPGMQMQTWRLLCCSSPSISIRSGDCIETKFLNDLHRSSSFSTGNQIVVRWQSILESESALRRSFHIHL
jgi:hypothetical protein